MHALEDILEWCKSHPHTLGLPLSQLSQMSHDLLAKEETPEEISEGSCQRGQIDGIKPLHHAFAMKLTSISGQRSFEH